MDKESLIDAIGEALFDLALAINDEFGGHHQDIPEKYRIVISLLSRYESLYVKDLARLLHVSSSSTSQLLSRMESEGYIIRELNPEKRTYTFVKLDQQGTDVLREMEQTRNEIASNYLMKLSLEDLTEFHDIAVKVKKIVERKREATK